MTVLLGLRESGTTFGEDEKPPYLVLCTTSQVNRMRPNLSEAFYKPLERNSKTGDRSQPLRCNDEAQNQQREKLEADIETCNTNIRHGCEHKFYWVALREENVLKL